jgi:hypothetical protein
MTAHVLGTPCARCGFTLSAHADGYCPIPGGAGAGPGGYRFVESTPSAHQAAPAEWLVWSNYHRAWWASNEQGYDARVEGAGRYTLVAAMRCASKRSSAAIPPELVVPSPELVARLRETQIGAEPDDRRRREARAIELLALIIACDGGHGSHGFDARIGYRSREEAVTVLRALHPEWTAEQEWAMAQRREWAQ